MQVRTSAMMTDSEPTIPFNALKQALLLFYSDSISTDVYSYLILQIRKVANLRVFQSCFSSRIFVLVSG